MSARGPRHRRRRARGGSSLAGDPLDLFLDAITNALGVIMFILLMVVLFGRVGAERSPSTAIAEAKRLEKEIERLAKEFAALPPAGDPEMERRLEDAIARIAAAERTTANILPQAERIAREAAEAVARAEESRRDLEGLTARLGLLAKAARPPGGFIRLSLLKDAGPNAEYLGISGGRVSRLRLTNDILEVTAPTDGMQIRDAAAAAAAARILLKGVDPKERRIEMFVWQGSFREGKLVEQAVIDAGFGINAIPVETGKALRRGESGVQ